MGAGRSYSSGGKGSTPKMSKAERELATEEAKIAQEEKN